MQMYFQIIKWLHLQPFSGAESQMCHSFPVILDDGVDWVTFCPEMQNDVHLVPLVCSLQSCWQCIGAVLAFL